jgi:hypothetical protein
MGGIADLVGNVWEHQDGLKLVGGKIIMPVDNDFAMPESDWPDTGATIDGVNGIQISGEITNRDWLSTSFRDVSVKEGYNIPAAIRQALIAPCSLASKAGMTEPIGHMWADNAARRTCIPVRFGSWNDGSNAGVAALILVCGREDVYTVIGFRLAYISDAKSV